MQLQVADVSGRPRRTPGTPDYNPVRVDSGYFDLLISDAVGGKDGEQMWDDNAEDCAKILSHHGVGSLLGL